MFKIGCKVKNSLDSNQITEQIHYAWHKRDETSEKINLSKTHAYTFTKSPCYFNLSMEVGPLARLIVNGEYTHGHACMDRNIARILETEKIL